jgi:hypothetical protein
MIYPTGAQVRATATGNLAYGSNSWQSGDKSDDKRHTLDHFLDLCHFAAFGPGAPCPGGRTQAQEMA